MVEIREKIDQLLIHEAIPETDFIGQQCSTTGTATKNPDGSSGVSVSITCT
jgi:hypothetical protein